MDRSGMIQHFWNDVAEQNPEALRSYFMRDAQVFWNNTNERFSVEEYIRANCEYPGHWAGEVERIGQLGDLVITAVRVWLTDQSASFHAVSFFEFEGDKIKKLNEYWGDDGEAPEWRQDKGIGTAIR